MSRTRHGIRLHASLERIEGVAAALRRAGRTEAEIDDALNYMAAREAGYSPVAAGAIADRAMARATPLADAGRRPQMTNTQ